MVHFYFINFWPEYYSDIYLHRKYSHVIDIFDIGSDDGKLSCGYSSFRGKRASMEDFFDVKIHEVDGQTVSLFGVFDG